jgi:hypothetical protein
MRLRNEGYNLEERSGFLLVNEVPYVNSQRQVQRGTLVVKLNLAGHTTVQPDTHVAHFIGEYPCKSDGSPIEGIRNASETKELAAGVTINHTFSAKPTPAGCYGDYYAQVSTYCSILAGQAKVIAPSATPKTFPPVVPDAEDDSPFHYIDTATSRAEIGAITQKLQLANVAIVGLGGTGAYVLDLIAKAPVRAIHLFDRDALLTHNAFRAPGAPSLGELRAKPKKVDHLKAIYSKMHRGIVAHAVHIDKDNVELLRTMDFVFLCLDDGPAKKVIIGNLDDFGLPFIDVGMGIYVGDGALGGTLRVTTSTPNRRNHVAARIPFAEANDANEYASNIQIADLNALNAALAVIKWKKLFGFYMDFENEYHSTYGIEVQLLTKQEQPA